MPVLPTYTAQIGGAAISGGRRASAEDFGSDIGNFSGTVNKVANSFIADKEESESRTALVASTEIRAKYAKALDEAALSGANLEQLKASMNDELAKVGSAFETKKGQSSLQLYTANSSIMFDEQANHIAVQRAASVARLEGSKFLNGAAALIQSNPLYLGAAEKDAEAFGATLRGISPEKRAEIVNGLKKELNATAAVSASRIDPEGTKKRLDAGEWDLTPEQRNMALNKAETEMRAKRADEAYQRAEEERKKHEADGKARDAQFARIMGGTATRRVIMDDVDLLPATREHLINVMEQRAKELAGEGGKTNPVIKRNLWLAINAPEDDPRKVYNADKIFAAVQAGHLSTADANQLNVMVAAQKDENNRSIGQRVAMIAGRQGVRIAQLAAFTSQPDKVANAQLDFQARVYEQISALRKANKNPNTLFDPNSKDYVGSNEFFDVSIQNAQHAASAQLPDKITHPLDALDVPIGQTFVDPNGTTRRMTKAMKEDLQREARASGGGIK